MKLIYVLFYPFPLCLNAIGRLLSLLCLDQSHLSQELTISSSFRKNPRHAAVSIKTVPNILNLSTTSSPSDANESVIILVKEAVLWRTGILALWRSMHHTTKHSCILLFHLWGFWQHRTITAEKHVHRIDIYIHIDTYLDVQRRMWRCSKCIKLWLLNSFPSNARRSTW